jgi:hypothetical protein
MGFPLLYLFARGLASVVDTGFETGSQGLTIQVSADQHIPAITGLSFRPRALQVALHEHVDRLEYVPAPASQDVEDPLGAQDIGAPHCHQVSKPFFKPGQIQGLVRCQRNATDTTGLNVVIFVVRVTVIIFTVTAMFAMHVSMVAIVIAVGDVAAMLIVDVLWSRSRRQHGQAFNAGQVKRSTADHCIELDLTT